jgi:hypothetical protein
MGSELSPPRSATSHSGDVFLSIKFRGVFQSKFEIQSKNYFGYLNQTSATASCAPIKKPFGNGGNP